VTIRQTGGRHRRNLGEAATGRDGAYLATPSGHTAVSHVNCEWCRRTLARDIALYRMLAARLLWVLGMYTKRFLALVLAAGCGTSIQTTPINPSPRAMAPRDPMTVELFTSGPPQRAHIDVAFFEAEESSSFSMHGTPEMMNALRQKGAQLGCDAVVVGGVSSRAPGVSDAEAWLVENPKARKGVFATCIVYTEAAVAKQ
jgi:hypothetical protein